MSPPFVGSYTTTNLTVLIPYFQTRPFSPCRRLAFGPPRQDRDRWCCAGRHRQRRWRHESMGDQLSRTLVPTTDGCKSSPSLNSQLWITTSSAGADQNHRLTGNISRQARHTLAVHTRARHRITTPSSTARNTKTSCGGTRVPLRSLL